MCTFFNILSFCNKICKAQYKVGHLLNVQTNKSKSLIFKNLSGPLAPPSLHLAPSLVDIFLDGKLFGYWQVPFKTNLLRGRNADVQRSIHQRIYVAIKSICVWNEMKLLEVSTCSSYWLNFPIEISAIRRHQNNSAGPSPLLFLTEIKRYYNVWTKRHFKMLNKNKVRIIPTLFDWNE